jgi:putative endonuclease
MAIAYILYSEKLDKFYIGASTLSVEERLARHNDVYYTDKFTSKGIPWVVFWFVKVNHMETAVKIENHIKRMKSKEYIQNLAKYPELEAKLLNLYDS